MTACNSNSKVVSFNRKNALAFAKKLYCKKGSKVEFTTLCAGAILKDIDGQSKLHCAIGEAYFQFVDHNMDRLQGFTTWAREALVEAAILKAKPSVLNKDVAEAHHELTEALNACITSNDTNDDGTDIKKIYIVRAKNVAKTWRERVVPLLK